MKWGRGEAEYFRNTTQKNSSVILTDSKQPCPQHSYLLFSFGRNFIVLFPSSLLKEKAQSRTCKLPGGEILDRSRVFFLVQLSEWSSVVTCCLLPGMFCPLLPQIDTAVSSQSGVWFCLLHYYPLHYYSQTSFYTSLANQKKELILCQLYSIFCMSFQSKRETKQINNSRHKKSAIYLNTDDEIQLSLTFFLMRPSFYS